MKRVAEKAPREKHRHAEPGLSSISQEPTSKGSLIRDNIFYWLFQEEDAARASDNTNKY